MTDREKYLMGETNSRVVLLHDGTDTTDGEQYFKGEHGTIHEYDESDDTFLVVLDRAFIDDEGFELLVAVYVSATSVERERF